MLCDSLLSNLEKLIIDEKESYILAKNKFSRTRNMDFKDFVYYILTNKGKTSVLEIDEFFELRFGEEKMPVSKQNVSKQRSYLSPLIFKDADKNGLKEIYSEELADLEKFKDFFLLNVDGSQFDIPNTPISREEFEVQPRALKKTESPKARVSVISDAKNEYILDSIISPFHRGEHSMAFENIENIGQIVDFEKAIVNFDRGYPSTELYMQLLDKKSHFIFRLKDTDYINERKKMKTDDEYIEILLNANRTRSIKNQELKEKAKEMTHLDMRIVNVTLNTGKIETLLTNLPAEIASSKELKELYGERWQIEKGYDILKNKLHIENFSAKKRLNIEQDFYSQIFMYNVLISAKKDLTMKIIEESENKECEAEYKIDINLLAGKLKSKLFPIIFTEDANERKKLWENIHRTIRRYLIKVKKKPKTKRKKKQGKIKYPYNNRKNF